MISEGQVTILPLHLRSARIILRYLWSLFSLAAVRTWDLEGEEHTDVVLDAGRLSFANKNQIQNSIMFKRL